MSTKSEFIEKATDERILLKELLPRLFDFEKYDIQYYMTSAEEKDHYDGYVMVYQKDTGKSLQRYIIEVKVRDTHYEKLMLEKPKYTNLKIKAKESHSKPLYINFTPNGCYIHNIYNIEKTITFKWTKEKHKASTVDKSKGKVNKIVTYLHTDLAKFIDLKQSELPRLKKEKAAQETVRKECIDHKQKKCLYKYLLFGENITKE
ncbi:MAG: hypothetical protein EOO06_00405 [Chitinophagaceae bacterium]|nr:MAG: hypothetical protein EOO06_00405 [Chitinophagaceae bacterium]